MNCVGIDVSKGKSMIAVMRPFGEVVVSPFEAQHTGSELSELAKRLKSLDGETRVVMESTGNYHAPVAWLLHDAGFYVSVVNAMLVHDYGNNSLRRAKADKKDAVKLANYGLDHWLTLPRYVPKDRKEERPFGEDIKMVRQHKLKCRFLTPPEQDKAIAKYAGGMTMTAIADEYGCHYTTIGRLLRKRRCTIQK